MKYVIYSEDTGRIIQIVDTETETQASIIRDRLIAEMKTKNLLGPDRLLIREMIIPENIGKDDE